MFLWDVILGNTPYLVRSFGVCWSVETVLIESVSPRVPLVEILMITNQGYWLLMVNIELSDRLSNIK